MPDPELIFKGGPEWHSGLMKSLVDQFVRESSGRTGPIRAPEEVRTRVDDLQRSSHIQPSQGFKISVTGDSEPIWFTSAEVFKTLKDPLFAKQLFVANTGREPTKKGYDGFSGAS